MFGKNFDWLEIHVVDHCNNKCKNCNNHSPFARKKEYSPADYFPWLDKMKEKGITFRTLSFLGGEPFLHSDLTWFVREFKKRYNFNFMLTSNLFWLSEANIRKYEELWFLVNSFHASFYDVIVNRLGGPDNVCRLFYGIKEINPALHLQHLEFRSFRDLKFTSKPMNVNLFCYNAQCTNLRADGKLARCGVGAYAHFNPHVTGEFLESKDMFYDLKSDTRDFGMWRYKYPFDSCMYCNHFLAECVEWEPEKKQKAIKADIADSPA